MRNPVLIRRDAQSNTETPRTPFTSDDVTWADSELKLVSRWILWATLPSFLLIRAIFCRRSSVFPLFLSHYQLPEEIKWLNTSERLSCVEISVGPAGTSFAPFKIFQVVFFLTWSDVKEDGFSKTATIITIINKLDIADFSPLLSYCKWVSVSYLVFLRSFGAAAAPVVCRPDCFFSSTQEHLILLFNAWTPLTTVL